MLTDKELSKLRLSILKKIYQTKSRKNVDLSAFTIYPSYLDNGYDEHDLDVVMNSLVVDGYVTKYNDDSFDDIVYPITQKGMDYCNENKGNKFIKYLIHNHLAIIAIIISIIALFKS